MCNNFGFYRSATLRFFSFIPWGLVYTELGGGAREGGRGEGSCVGRSGGGGGGGNYVETSEGGRGGGGVTVHCVVEVVTLRGLVKVWNLGCKM